MPGYAADGDDRDAFTTASDILGTAIGETLGYLLTAPWTALVIVALGRRFAGPLVRRARRASRRRSSLVGVFSPLDLPVVDTANFIGYVLWSLWLIAFGVVLLVASASRRGGGGDVVSPRWVALGVLCTSLLVIVVDNTIVNVALPTLARELDADVSELQWVVDAYTLVFAGLLLLGRRARAIATGAGARCSPGWSCSPLARRRRLRGRRRRADRRPRGDGRRRRRSSCRRRSRC